MSSIARPLTLADIAVPRSSAVSDVILVLVASLVTALAAQAEIRLPWTPVPITGQSFAVLLSGLVLGSRRALLAQMLYLSYGAAGLPVFSGGGAGLVQFMGPAGGYLVGFPFAALVTGLLAERGWDRKPHTMFAAMLLGSAVIFALGLAQLSRFMPSEGLLAAGLLPFIPGDLIKSALAAGVFPLVWRMANPGGGAK